MALYAKSFCEEAYVNLTFWARSIHSLHSVILVFKSSVMKVTMIESSLPQSHGWESQGGGGAAWG